MPKRVACGRLTSWVQSIYIDGKVDRVLGSDTLPNLFDDAVRAYTTPLAGWKEKKIEN